MGVIKESDLRSALARGEILPFFQPLVHLRTGSLVGHEVLARWRHPEHGMIPPSEFIPLAESVNLIEQLTVRLLCQAFSMARSLPPAHRLSVNISPLQLRDSTLPQQIRDIAAATGFALERLTVEITESAIVENLDMGRSIAEDLKSLGMRLALDDFGTGYSSLRHLQALPFDELKIDRSFVSSMISERESRKIVAAVIGLGASLGLTTLAEGIEDHQQAEMLLCLGCELGQGWLYGKAVAAEEMLEQATGKWSHSSTDAAASQPRGTSEICLEALPAQRSAHLQAIYHGAPVGLCFLDRKLRYVNLNDRLSEMNGLPVNQHLGRTVEEIHPVLFHKVRPYLQRALAGEACEGVEFEDGERAGSRERRTILVSYQPARDEANEVIGISVSVIDITQRKRSEEALKRSEDHYRNMVELNPQVPWTMGPNGGSLEVSPRWEQITGISADEARNMGWLRAVHPEDVQRTAEVCRSTVKAGDLIDVECRIQGGRGTWKWMRLRGAPRRNEDGRIVRWYGTMEVIDAQKNAEEELRAAQMRLQAIIDAVPVGIVIAEAPSGRIVGRNPAARRILQLDPLRFENMEDYSTNVTYRRRGRRMEASEFPISRAIATGETTRSERVYLEIGADDGKWIDLTGAPIRDQQGAIVGAVAVIQEAGNEEGEHHLSCAVPSWGEVQP